MGDYLKFTRSKNTDMLWKYFAPIIGNNFGTAGLMAGLYLRSGCDPYTGYENYMWGGIDHSADGKIELKDFAYDRKGFGIGKWKDWTRKQSLHNFCRVAGTPIYDIATQADFVMDEFSGTTYGPVLQELMDATSVAEAAYLVYDRFMDIKKRSDDRREICAELALEIYATYGVPNELMVPVKYVTTDRPNVLVRGQKAKKFPFLRKWIGYLTQGESYRFISVSDDGKEYALYFNDEFGYVKASKVTIVTRMEAIK